MFSHYHQPIVYQVLISSYKTILLTDISENKQWISCLIKLCSYKTNVALLGCFTTLIQPTLFTLSAVRLL